MIYAAYAGTGKSYFCQENPEAIDLICMPFKYTNLSEVSGNMESDREGEQIKANPKLTLRNYWVLYYYWAIKYLLYYCPEIPLVIPTIDLILDFLEADQIPYTLIYPDKNLKDEYEKRYKNRGNTEEFLDIFIGQWEFRIEELEQRNSPLTKHIVLQEGQYLSDDLLICGSHFPCESDEIFLNHMENFVIDNLNDDFLLVGDLNANDQTRENKKMINRLLDKGAVDLWMMFGNDENTPTEAQYQGRLDYAIASPSLAKKVKNMEIDPFLMNASVTDHAAIIVDINE